MIVRPQRPHPAPSQLALRTRCCSCPIACWPRWLAGLVMVRLLVRRLRGIELLAARVAEGDLSVRIGGHERRRDRPARRRSSIA